MERLRPGTYLVVTSGVRSFDFAQDDNKIARFIFWLFQDDKAVFCHPEKN
jgi:hypothetical protein